MSIQKRYEKICEKIEQLNDEAFELEKEMLYLNNKKGDE